MTNETNSAIRTPGREYPERANDSENSLFERMLESCASANAYSAIDALCSARVALRAGHFANAAKQARIARLALIEGEKFAASLVSWLTETRLTVRENFEPQPNGKGNNETA